MTSRTGRAAGSRKLEHRWRVPGGSFMLSADSGVDKVEEGLVMGFQEVSGAAGLVFSGAAIGGAWIAAIVSPNCSFDKLTGARADTHVRELLYRALLPIALMMLVCAGLFLVAGSWAAAIAGGLSAFGFLATRLMLAPKKGRNPRGVPTRRRDQRAISVLLCLMFMLSSLVAVLLGLLGL